MSEIGTIIKNLRKVAKLSQKELAKSLGISPSTLSEYEHGNKRPSYEILIAIANLFDVTTDYLLGREEYK